MASCNSPPALTQAMPMAQVDSITTAIRELMSRGQPPKSTNPVRAAHAEFVSALAGNAPHPIHSALGPTDLDGRADHLQKVLAALHVYVAALTADLAQNIPAASVDRLYLDQLFEQFSSDALRVIRNAAAELRVRENWRAL